MTDNKTLLALSEKQDIEIITTDCGKCGSVSLLTDDGCYIGINGNLTENEFREHTAHELGHCIKGAFYNRYSPYDLISRAESRADQWAIETLVPKAELISELKKNVESIYELSEKFGVSEDFMKKACRYYDMYNDGI